MAKRDREAMQRALEARPFCRVCGTTVGLHVHHVVERRRTQCDDLDNLVVLCADHHQAVHDKRCDIGSFLSPEEQAKVVLLTGSLTLAIKHVYPTEHALT